MYGKIFASMFKGSLYGHWEAIVTFTVMIVLADEHGEVDMTPEALAAATSIPLRIVKKGIAELEAPDDKSRTPDEEGRRIVRVSDARDWGWIITNYAHYRAIRTAEERREYFKQHKRKQRAKVKDKEADSNASPPLSTSGPQSPPIAEVEAEAVNTPSALFDGVTVDQQVAYEKIRAGCRNPTSFDAMLRAVRQPTTGGAAYAWPVIAQALLEMHANGSAVTANGLRAFCRKLTEPEPAPTGYQSKQERGRAALLRGLQRNGFTNGLATDDREVSRPVPRALPDPRHDRPDRGRVVDRVG